MTALGRRAGATADRPTSSLSWVRLAGSESCIAAAELGTRVEAHLGRTVFSSPSTANVSIEGHVERRGKRFVAMLGGSGRDGTPIGTRQLDSEGADCRSLDVALILVIALMIDPDAVAAAAATAPAAPTPPPPPATREAGREIVVREIHDGPPTAASGPPPPPAPWRLDAHVDATLGLGRLPGRTPGVMLGVGFGPTPRFPLELTLGTSPSASADTGGRSVSFSLVEGGLGFCPDVPVGGRVTVGGCASVRVGRIRSVGSGFDRNEAIDRVLADVVVGARAGVTLVRPFFAVATASAVVPMARQRTTFRGADGAEVLLHERAAFGAELAIGVGVRFSP